MMPFKLNVKGICFIFVKIRPHTYAWHEKIELEIVALSHSITQTHSYAVVLGEINGSAGSLL